MATAKITNRQHNPGAVEGFMVSDGASGQVEILRSNLAAGGNPTVTDDAAAGYSIGSQWLNGTELFMLTDSTNGAAVWSLMSADYTADEATLTLTGNVSGTEFSILDDGVTGPKIDSLTRAVTGLVNGVNAAFTMSQEPDPATFVTTINGLVQSPADYTIAGTTLTFTDAPEDRRRC